MLLIRLCTFKCLTEHIQIYCNKAFGKMKVILIFPHGILIRLNGNYKATK